MTRRLNAGLAFCVLVTVAPLTPAAAQVGTFVSSAVSVGGRTHVYSVWLPPDFVATKRYAAALVLHGAGSRGSDGMAPRRQSVVAAAQLYPDRYNAILVLPQCPVDARWEGPMLSVALAALAGA